MDWKVMTQKLTAMLIKSMLPAAAGAVGGFVALANPPVFAALCGVS